jgi:hypothetical protein
MNDLLPDPPRWKERTDQANLAEREAGRAIRFMRAPEPLPAAQLTRIAARVRAARSQRRYFWLTVTAAVLLCGATVASAAHLNVLPGWLTRMVKPRPAESAPHKRASLGPARRMPATATAGAPVPPEPTAQPSQPPFAPDQPMHDSRAANPASAAVGANLIGHDPTSLSVRKPLHKPVETALVEDPRIPKQPAQAAELEPPRSPSIAPATAVSSMPAQLPGAQVARLEGSNPAPETGSAQGTAKYLSEAIHALRVEHSPGTALFLLDRHATQLGKSTFAHEALLLRVEAMLALGHKAEVLRLLDGAALTDVAASRSLLVTRGELRAAANRCADGLGDFDLVLAKSKQADRQALFGRALCRKKLGDSAGAQADIERYRREFPTDPRLSDFARE